MSAALPAAVRAATVPQDGLPALVHELLTDLVLVLSGADSATVVTVTPTGLRPWAATGSAGREVDRLQTRAGQGPAFDAVSQGGSVVTADLCSDERWQLLAGDQVRARSVVAMSLPGPLGIPAVLSVHGLGPDLVAPFVVEKITAAVTDLASTVCVVRARMEVADLRTALITNRAIGAAIGITMATRRLRYDDAAGLLRSLSNDTNTRLADLADDIVFTGEVPHLPGRQAGKLHVSDVGH